MNRVPIGELLVLRDDYARIAAKEEHAFATRLMAKRTAEALDELIDRREKEVGAHG